MKTEQTKKLEAALKNWHTLMGFVKSADEADVWDALKYEAKHKRRSFITFRLYGHASKLRRQRELKELNKALGE